MELSSPAECVMVKSIRSTLSMMLVKRNGPFRDMSRIAKEVVEPELPSALIKIDLSDTVLNYKDFARISSIKVLAYQGYLFHSDSSPS